MKGWTTLLLVPFQPTLGWRTILGSGKFLNKRSAEVWFASPFKNLSSGQEHEFKQSCVRKPSGARTWLGLVRPRHKATFSTTQTLWSPLSQRTWWRERQRMWKWSDSRIFIDFFFFLGSLLMMAVTLRKVFLTTSFPYVVSHLILTIQDLPVDIDPEERYICPE